MKKVVIITNVLALRLTIIKKMKSQDYFFFEADNGMDGIKRCIREKPELVICDLDLSDMSGLEVIQQIKIKNPDIKTIIMAERTNSDVERAKTLGAVFVSKPVDLAEIEKTILNIDEIRPETVSFTKNAMVVSKFINVRHQLKKILSTLGYDVDENENGRAAIERLKLKKWDILFYDSQNPFFSGDELIKYLEDKGCNFKLVMMNSSEKQAYGTFIQFRLLNVPFTESDVMKAMKDDEKE